MVYMITKIFQKITNDFYKLEILRTFIVLIRFFIFFKILKKQKSFVNEKEIQDQHITIERDNKKLNVGDHNLHYSENLFKLKKTYLKFNGSKTKTICDPLSSIDYIDFQKAKVLSVGPRNEGELYYLRSMGFLWKNISAIDLISYSKKISLGDIHKTSFHDNSFDIIICGWVLPYSNNYKKILDEIYRISKHNTVLSLGYTYIPENIDIIRKYKSSEHRLNSNKQIIDFFGKKIKSIYFNFDAFLNNPENKRHSIFIFNFNKKD